jgi:hypothetical protein
MSLLLISNKIFLSLHGLFPVHPRSAVGELADATLDALLMELYLAKPAIPGWPKQYWSLTHLDGR